MIIQASIPRPRFDIHERPEYIYIHTLARVGISSGNVLFTGTVDPTIGTRQSRQLDPINVYPIEGESGFEGYEYVLPFFELYKNTIAVRKEVMEKTGASGYGSIGLIPFTTAGFQVTIKSAFRASPTTYEEHTLGLAIMMPVTGGGILRLGDCPFDLSNPTFNPHAPNPRAIMNLDVSRMLNQAHKAPNAAIEDRRAARIAAAERAMAAATPALPGPVKALPPGSTSRTKS